MKHKVTLLEYSTCTLTTASYWILFSAVLKKKKSTKQEVLKSLKTQKVTDCFKDIMRNISKNNLSFQQCPKMEISDFTQGNCAFHVVVCHHKTSRRVREWGRNSDSKRNVNKTFKTWPRLNVSAWDVTLFLIVYQSLHWFLQGKFLSEFCWTILKAGKH